MIFFITLVSAQEVDKRNQLKVPNKENEDTLIIDSGKKDSLKIFKPTINDYLYQTQYSVKKPFDTVLTYQKGYEFTQYNNKDNFGKIQFSNIGAGFNPLSYEINSEENLSLLPTNKSYGILGINDIRYYDVKTPTATFVYHNAVKNGAALKSTYTQNIGKNFNFSLEYMGLRSQGSYRNNLASNNNTLFSGHFVNNKGNYEFFAHFLHQNVNNQENGGIVDDDLFQSGDSNYSNKANVQVNLQGSNSQFSYRRYYFSQQFTPFNSEKFPFKIRHTIFNQGNKYYYNQTSLEDYWYTDSSQLLNNFPLSTKKYSNNFSNSLSLVFDNEKFKLDVGARYQILKYGLVNLPVNSTIPEETKENRFGALGNLQIKLFDKIQLNSFLEFSNGSQFGNYVKSTNKLMFEPIKDYVVNLKANFQSAYPSFNYLANTSVYKEFNYYLANPKNQNITEFGGDINLKWFKTNLFVNYFTISNYTYFNENAQPLQAESAINISQIGGEATFTYNKFHLNTRLQFQNALTNKDLLPMPSFIGRANFYYQAKAFKNAAELQAGIKVYYFSKFASRDYLPIINEYILPNSNSFSIGGQSIADIYLNLKVKRMFFFLEGQQIGTVFSHNQAYAFPHYPVYDFRLNIGIVWYLFN